MRNPIFLYCLRLSYELVFGNGCENQFGVEKRALVLQVELSENMLKNIKKMWLL